ncbi:corticosteroid- binding protein, partial [Blyttiomyces sp. JEL0837]
MKLLHTVSALTLLVMAVSGTVIPDLSMKLLKAMESAYTSNVDDDSDSSMRFDGEQVWRLNIPNAEALDRVVLLREMVPALDFWTEPRIGFETDIRVVNGGAAETLKTYLSNFNIEHKVFIDDIQKAIEQQNLVESDSDDLDFEQDDDSNQIVLQPPSTQQYFKDYFTKYRTMDEIYEFIHKEIVFDSTLHSREWIGAGCTQYIALQLVQLYGSDKTVTKIVDRFDFTIIPVVNVDGYVYTHTKNRM